MKRFVAKLGFIHARLWQRDGLYRAAALFGPPPLLGAAVAAVIWFGVAAVSPMPQGSLSWAVPHRNAEWDPSSASPEIVRPDRPLPATGADGMLVGYRSGWAVTAHPIQIDRTMDVNVSATALNAMTINGTSVDMADILAGGPKATLYVAVGIGFLAIRTLGIYALRAHLQRPSAPAADCLVRLGFGSRRISSDLEVDMVSEVRKDFTVDHFDLQPGL
jgi:hypothetical protein